MGQSNWLIEKKFKNKNKNRTWKAPHVINIRGD
jgi:hypothetical protein